jgi:hydrogenase/urease accessory protein HupE
VALLFWLLTALLAGPVRADAIHVGHFSLLPGQQGQNSHELIGDLPADAETSAAVTLPAGCKPTDETRQSMAGRTRFSLRFACTAALPADAVIRLDWPLDGASFRPQGGAHVSLLPDDDGISLPLGASLAGPHAGLAVVRAYLGEGLVHILTGWDHLAFVLCLCLLAQGRRLLLLVTLFTLGHSISLAGGVFDWVRLPMPPVEAAIALSILFMAREAMLPARASGWQRQALITGGFGLLHGLGFASALGEMGVASDDRLVALLGFNLGVEAGQLLFVAAVLAVMAAARRFGWQASAQSLVLHAAGAMAGFWLLQRLAGFAA